MSVLLPNCSLGVKRRGLLTENAYGEKILDAPADMEGPWPSSKRKRDDDSWTFRLDMAVLPIRDGDLLVDVDTGQEWLVTTHATLTNDAADDVDYVRAEGRIRAATSTQPPGAER